MTAHHGHDEEEHERKDDVEIHHRYIQGSSIVSITSAVHDRK